MTITYHKELVQGSTEWLECRRGRLTASEMKHIITAKKLEYATGDKMKAHLFELLSQRVSGYIEPQYIGDDMLRGMEDEVTARILYEQHYAPVQECGFITNDKWGFTLGYSPDGLVGDDGAIECKSRRQKFQVETIISDEVPDDYTIQLQTGLLVSERKWVDFISYSGGLPMFVKRVVPDEKVQAAILNAATLFHVDMNSAYRSYDEKQGRFIKTERKIEEEITI